MISPSGQEAQETRAASCKSDAESPSSLPNWSSRSSLRRRPRSERGRRQFSGDAPVGEQDGSAASPEAHARTRARGARDLQGRATARGPLTTRRALVRPPARRADLRPARAPGRKPGRGARRHRAGPDGPRGEDRARLIVDRPTRAARARRLARKWRGCDGVSTIRAGSSFPGTPEGRTCDRSTMCSVDSFAGPWRPVASPIRPWPAPSRRSSTSITPTTSPRADAPPTPPARGARVAIKERAGASSNSARDRDRPSGLLA